jgi:hypothetical protein
MNTAYTCSISSDSTDRGTGFQPLAVRKAIASGMLRYTPSPCLSEPFVPQNDKKPVGLVRQPVFTSKTCIKIIIIIIIIIIINWTASVV